MSFRFASLPILLRTRKLRLQPMVRDGNCFYRAVSAVYYKDAEMHHLLRRIAAEHMMSEVSAHVPWIFDSKNTLMHKITAIQRLGAWSAELSDLVPDAVARMIGCCIEVHSVQGGEVVSCRYGEDLGNCIRLLCKDNHYDLLVKD